MNKAVLTALQNATKGLLYPSETDKPFEPISWGKADGDLTPQKVAALVKAPAGTAVEAQSLADFFQYLIADGTEHAKEFRQLQQVIGKQLGRRPGVPRRQRDPRCVHRRPNRGRRVGRPQDAIGGNLIRLAATRQRSALGPRAPPARCG